MKYAIIGSGKIGTALARAFARENIAVEIANSAGGGWSVRSRIVPLD